MSENNWHHLAEALPRIIAMAPRDASMDDLVALVADKKAPQKEWRWAAVYLAAQLNNAEAMQNVQALRRAKLALSQIRTSAQSFVDWDERNTDE